MDGIEMAAKIRELYPDCVILFLSGYSDKEYLRSAISLHALQYIDKPVLPEQVISAVKEAVSYCNNLRNTSFAAKIKEVRLARLLCTPKPVQASCPVSWKSARFLLWPSQIPGQF